MLNRLLGIDNCIKCSKLLKLPNEIICSKYKKKLELTCFKIPLKLQCCTEPFRYDSKPRNKADE